VLQPEGHFAEIMLEPQGFGVCTDGAPLGLIEPRRIDCGDVDQNFKPRAVDPNKWLKDLVNDFREVRDVSRGVEITPVTALLPSVDETSQSMRENAGEFSSRCETLRG
jgi:hypothetical protein